jgi:hypothetical protein
MGLLLDGNAAGAALAPGTRYPSAELPSSSGTDVVLVSLEVPPTGP